MEDLRDKVDQYSRDISIKDLELEELNFKNESKTK